MIVGTVDVFRVRAGVNGELVERDLMAGIAAKRLIDVTGLPFERKRWVAVVLEIFGLPRLRQNSHRAFVAAVPAFDGESGGVHSAIICQEGDAEVFTPPMASAGSWKDDAGFYAPPAGRRRGGNPTSWRVKMLE